jgi:hypothetical protein
MHFTVYDIAKIWYPAEGDDGNEVITGAGVIPTRQAGGGYAVFTPEAVHRYCLYYCIRKMWEDKQE